MGFVRFLGYPPPRYVLYCAFACAAMYLAAFSRLIHMRFNQPFNVKTHVTCTCIDSTGAIHATQRKSTVGIGPSAAFRYLIPSFKSC